MSLGQSDPLTWTFLAPGSARPTGGDLARFRLVNELARPGVDRVQVVHIPTDDKEIRGLGDLPWFRFDPGVEHHFAPDLDPDGLPQADVVVYSTRLLATALPPEPTGDGRRLVAALQERPARLGLPLLFLQGHGVFPAAIEALAFRLPGPKVCVGSWLAEVVRATGVPASEVVCIPNGLDPDTFRLTRPIAGRAPSVSMNFDPYPLKRGEQGVEAVRRLNRRLDVPAVIFGTVPLELELPPGLVFVSALSQTALADDVYNQTSMFLQPSRHEGFGMCAVEAMACGCALVTTDNGGSAEYAFDGETALVCGGQPEQMVEALSRLVGDDALRARLAIEGSRYVERFRWSTSAQRLRAFAADRLAAPTVALASDPIDLDEVVRDLRIQVQRPVSG